MGEEPEKVAVEEEKPTEKIKKAPKPVKKSIPTWATLSDDDKKKLSEKVKVKIDSNKPKVEEVVLEAITAKGDSKGVASAIGIRNYIKKEYPTWPKMLIKKGVLRAVANKKVKQVKGEGFSGSFKIDTTAKAAKKPTKKSNKKSDDKENTAKVPLEEVLPYIFTWACNPKEASSTLIKKYIKKHHPSLDTDGKAFRKALENGVAKGQLDQITGKGISGTFQLIDGANKTGTKFEDAIEDAIIAMNEPKDVSVTGIRNYMDEYHPEYKTDQRPRVLKNALDKSTAKGWLRQVTGKGFSGTYRLNYPFHPSPVQLWGDEAKVADDKPKKKPKVAKEEPKKKKRKVAESSDEDESSSEEESEEEEEEVIPTPKKRGAPTPRKNALAKKAPKKKAPAKKPAKSKPAKKTKKGRGKK